MSVSSSSGTSSSSDSSRPSCRSSDHDWPRLDRLGFDGTRVASARAAWWSIVTAVERRVEAITPGSGGYDEAYCWPAYRANGGRWLAVIEAAGLHVVGQFLPVSERARCQPQLELWPRHEDRVGS